MNKSKGVCDRAEPYGTPLLISLKEVQTSSTTVIIYLSERKLKIKVQ